MSELRDRLERLAARGTRRGADDVLQRARCAARRRGGSRSRPDADDRRSRRSSTTTLPFVTAEPDAHRRGRFGTLVAAVGVAALVGVGALAVTAMFGSGGAGSPEGAVRQLADAISHKDPLAAVDVLVPTRGALDARDGEGRDAARGRPEDRRRREPAARRRRPLRRPLQLSTETLADGYAKVTITSGEISASTHRRRCRSCCRTRSTARGPDDSQGQGRPRAARGRAPTSRRSSWPSGTTAAGT